MESILRNARLIDSESEPLIFSFSFGLKMGVCRGNPDSYRGFQVKNKRKRSSSDSESIIFAFLSDAFHFF